VISLTWPQVRAWRLARQSLSPRARGPAELQRVVADMCGVQAQLTSSMELQFAARIQDVAPEDVREALWERRSLVRTWAMRGTLHLFPAEYFPLYAAALRTRDHWRKPAWLRGHGVSLEDVEAALQAIGQALDGQSLTRSELTEAVTAKAGGHLAETLSSGWGELLKPAAYQGVICSGPNRGRNVTFVRPDQWVEGWRVLDPDRSLREVIRRFVHMHGPTRPENFAHWWGTTPGAIRRVWRSMEGVLEEVEVEGDHAWALGTDVGALADAEPDSSVRLVPNFDSYLLAYHPRSTLVRDAVRALVFREQAWISTAVLIGGRVAGLWELERTKDQALVRVEPFGRLPAGARKDIRAEAERIGSFLGLEPTIRFEPVSHPARAPRLPIGGR
jgi:hypothetical protein